jgi:hypothetical protein
VFVLLEECVHFIDKTFSDYDHEMLQDAARKYLVSCRDSLDELSRGYMRVSADDKRLSLMAIRSTNRHIRAVSITRTDLPTWFTPSGERYLSENEAAVKRGVLIERIFLYETMSDSLSTLVSRLLAMKTKVFLLPYNRVPAEKRIDMVIFDDTFAVETRTNAEGVFIENLFSANASDIQKRSAEFAFLKGLADEQLNTPGLQVVQPIAQPRRKA